MDGGAGNDRNCRAGGGGGAGRGMARWAARGTASRVPRLEVAAFHAPVCLTLHCVKEEGRVKLEDRRKTKGRGKRNIVSSAGV